MDVKGHSKVCSQCLKEVAVDNLALHESHCGRFLCVCPDCDETVPKTLLEQHRLDEHSQVNCSECNQHMERRLLVDHKLQECVARLRSCEFCELELPIKTLSDHQVACGSRTERCAVCQRYVLLSDSARHSDTCWAAVGATAGVQPPLARHGRPPRTTTTKEDESDDIPSSQEEEEDDDDDEEEKERGACAIKLPLRPQEEEEGYQDRVHPCSYCQLLLPEVTLRWHEPKCKIHFIMK